MPPSPLVYHIDNKIVRFTPTWYENYSTRITHSAENLSFTIKYILLPVRTVWSADTEITLGPQDQLSIRIHPHTDWKWTKLCLGPIQTCLEAFLGFLGKTKMKAYTKLTVVMCCQIVARKSVAPSSGDFRRRPAPRYACGQDQEFWSKKVLVKY